MFSFHPSDDQKTGLVSRASRDFDEVWVVPQYLRLFEIDSVFLLVCGTFRWIVLKLHGIKSIPGPHFCQCFAFRPDVVKTDLSIGGPLFDRVLCGPPNEHLRKSTIDSEPPEQQPQTRLVAEKDGKRLKRK